MVSPTQGQVAHALLTRPPLGIAAPFDLNVLCTPPAFILSQDQTLEKIVFPQACACTNLPSCFLALLLLEYTLLSMFLLKGIYEISFTLLVLCTFSLVVQFSRTVPLSSSAAFRLPAPVASRRALA